MAALGIGALAVGSGGLPVWLRPLLTTPQARRLGPLLGRGIRAHGQDILPRSWHDPTPLTPGSSAEADPGGR